MRCSNCGHEIPNGMLYCKYCGEEIRFVPDYNPLDDMLTAQIKVSISDKRNNLDQNVNNRQHTERTLKKNSDDREARRKQAERRREIKRRKRRKLIVIMLTILAAGIGLIILLYQTSYTGIVKKGNNALLSSKYAIAEEYFVKAIEKKPEQPEAYAGLSQVFIVKNDFTGAENVFLDAIKEYPDNASVYEVCIQFYLDTDQALKIPKLLSKSNDKIQKTLKEYVVEKPKFSLDAKKVYDDVQQLTLTTNEETIYYTIDGTDPTFNSAKYVEPIHLEEGETIIKAIAVNKKGVPGFAEEQKYIIELPVEDAPAISPSTGQYDQPVKIEIKVPEGYTAYYTMDGSTPTTASMKYTGPIDMPEKDTLFKAILVNARGRTSGITTRNYILDISDESEE